MKQAVDCDLFLYIDDSCLVYQHKDAKEIEGNLNNNFSDVCDRLVDNKLSIHFGEGKIKCILFGNSTTITSLLKLHQPLRRTNHGQNNIFYIVPIICNNLPNSLKTTDNLNTNKYRIKDHFFHRIRIEANNIYCYF